MATLFYGVISPATGTDKAKPTGFVSSLVQAITAEWRTRRAARSVEALSDSMLHDIGITRGEIDQAVRFGRGRRF